MERELYQLNEEIQVFPDKYIAIYLRVSDEDKGVGALKGESDSIANQRSLIYNFIHTHRELSGYPVREFLDDGSTGVTFRRSGIQKLLTEVERNHIFCVVVKDLSRFGRDYIESGMYLEQFFPLMGVRFLSISDAYDSLDNPAGIEIGFKNLIYDCYSRDLSKKIRAVKLLQQKNGCYSGGDVPYGYRKRIDGQEGLQPDPETAGNITTIFSLAADGCSPSAIAGYLNQQKLPTPGAYKKQSAKRKYQLKNKKSNLWTSLQVRIILQNETYLGTYLCHKSIVGRPRERRKLEASEYMRFENAHPALISREVFEAAQHVIKYYEKRGSYRKKASAHPLSGKIKCGHCGYSVRLGGKTPNLYFRCRMGESCGSGIRVNAQVLEEVIQVIHYQLMAFLEDGGELLFFSPIQAEPLQIGDFVKRWIEKIEVYSRDRIEILVLI